jgi:hypothetical protein
VLIWLWWLLFVFASTRLRTIRRIKQGNGEEIYTATVAIVMRCVCAFYHVCSSRVISSRFSEIPRVSESICLLTEVSACYLALIQIERCRPIDYIMMLCLPRSRETELFLGLPAWQQVPGVCTCSEESAPPRWGI